MISSALIRCKIESEVRIIDLSIFHFVFRVPKKIDSIPSMQLSFYNGKNYETMHLYDFSYTLEEETEFYYVYRVETEDESYAQHVRKLMEMLQRYTQYKLEDEQEKWIQYPLNLDSVFSKSKDDMLESMFSNLNVQPTYKNLFQNIPLGICLDNPVLYKQFLSKEWHLFKNEYYTNHYLDKHPISQIDIQYLYIGNQFCEHLFPKKEECAQMIKKCIEIGIKPVFLFSPMKEHKISFYKEILDVLPVSSEIVVNDLGLLELIKEYSFIVIQGILLNKHSKDPRLKYMDLDIPKETSHKERLSYESCGYTYELPPSCDFYFPKYQTNTSGTCTMAALCKNGNRAYQEEMMDCSMYCLSQHFLYPSHLHTIGEYNSIFGYDIRILYDETYVESILSQNVERMILTI